MKSEKRNEYLTAVSASMGIAIGRAIVIEPDSIVVPKRRISKREVKTEILRFQEALSKVEEEISGIREKVGKETGSQIIIDILKYYKMVLRDPSLIGDTSLKIESDLINAEQAFSIVIQEAANKLELVEDKYFKERSSDFMDIGKRVLRAMLGYQHNKLSNLKEPGIVIAHDLAPSETAQMDKTKVLGFATDIGGPTSHTAIMARCLEVPAVVGLGNISTKVSPNDSVIIDGTRGTVIVQPNMKTLKRYYKMKKEYKDFEVRLQKIKDLDAVTLDGFQIDIRANIELSSEVEAVKKHGARGVGLFRTEFMFMNSAGLPDEETQYKNYSIVASEVYPNPVIIRTLDIGGDKFLNNPDIPKEFNPSLGCRAIRFCLERTDIFRTQLRAILRASALGNVKLLYPMISGLTEIHQANDFLELSKDELRKEGVEFDENIEVGIMIEVPSIALIADIVAKEVDFFSIGTNDLIQYTLAVDRGNERMAYLYDPLHPAVLRFIYDIVETAHHAGIPVGMCGEMAGSPALTLVLLGLGLDELSMSPISVPEVKQIIRSVRYEAVKSLVNEVLSKCTCMEIKDLVANRSKEILPDFPW